MELNEKTLAQYHQGFLPSTAIRNMAINLAETKAWWELIARGLQASGVAALYEMWRKQRETEMDLDKQGLSTEIHQDSHTVTETTT